MADDLFYDWYDNSADIGSDFDLDHLLSQVSPNSSSDKNSSANSFAPFSPLSSQLPQNLFQYEDQSRNLIGAPMSQIALSETPQSALNSFAPQRFERIGDNHTALTSANESHSASLRPGPNKKIISPKSRAYRNTAIRNRGQKRKPKSDEKSPSGVLANPLITTTPPPLDLANAADTVASTEMAHTLVSPALSDSAAFGCRYPHQQQQQQQQQPALFDFLRTNEGIRFDHEAASDSDATETASRFDSNPQYSDVTVSPEVDNGRLAFDECEGWYDGGSESFVRFPKSHYHDSALYSRSKGFNSYAFDARRPMPYMRPARYPASPKRKRVCEDQERYDQDTFYYDDGFDAALNDERGRSISSWSDSDLVSRAQSQMQRYKRIRYLSIPAMPSHAFKSNYEQSKQPSLHSHLDYYNNKSPAYDLVQPEGHLSMPTSQLFDSAESPNSPKHFEAAPQPRFLLPSKEDQSPPPPVIRSGLPTPPSSGKHGRGSRKTSLQTGGEINGLFINFTANDKEKILSGVAPSGSSRNKDVKRKSSGEGLRS